MELGALQGNCSVAEPEVALAGVGLATLKEGQCAIFSSMDVFQVSGMEQGLWLTNVLLRVARTNEDQVRHPSF